MVLQAFHGPASRSLPAIGSSQQDPEVDSVPDQDPSDLSPSPCEFIPGFSDLAPFDDFDNTNCWLFQGTSNHLAHHKTHWADCESDDESRETLRHEIIQEVQALFARWLRMQNLVVLTGAGTSVCADGKLGKELLPGAKELVSGRATADLLDRLLDCSVQQNLNFEEFLSYLCAIRRCLKGSPQSFQNPFQVMLPSPTDTQDLLNAPDLDALLSDLEAAIAAMCSPRLPIEDLADETTQQDPHLAFIGKIVSRDPRLGRAKLCTLNYDTLFEQAMDLLHVLYADGFTGRVERHFNPASFDLDYYFPGQVSEGRVRRYDKFLHLYKLHGSVDWRKSEISPENVHGVTWCGKSLVKESDILEHGATLDEVFTGHCAPQYSSTSDSTGIGLAILPTSAKYGESIAMPYAHLFRMFAQTTQEPNTVLMVIGYTGWDNHVNRIIEDALTNPSFTLVIVDPALGR